MSRWMTSAAIALLATTLAGCGDATTTIELGVVGGTTSTSGAAAHPEPVTEPTLAACGDVPPVVAEASGGPAGSTLDQQVLTVLRDYGAAAGDSFAGLWLDAGSTGAVVIAFTDPIDHHRDALVAALGADPGAPPFAVAMAANSEADLARSVEDALALDIESLVAGSLDVTRNRSVLELVDPTAADIERLTAGVDLDHVCIETILSPPRPAGPLEVLPRPGLDRLLTCGDVAFPAAALTELVPLPAVDHPAATLLAEFVASGDWIALAIDDERAYFGQYDGQVQATALVTASGSAWEVAGWSFGCELRVGLPSGLDPVEVFLDPAAPPGPDSTAVQLLVAELGCSGGRPMGDRLVEPEVIETEDSVLVAFAVAPRATGSHGAGGDEVAERPAECPVNPLHAVTIELASPLAGRVLADGTQLPPRPLGPSGR